MAPLPRAVANDKISALVAGAAIVRAEVSEPSALAAR
jgi:5-methyltetrahydropteroyltriglutamate--homocysteine methyltransferase